MDAFFASVEQRDNPDYRGKPLIVGSTPDQRGVVCAASYEARRFGVRSALPSRTAGKLCPTGIFVRPRMDAYRAESAQVMQILHSFTSAIEKISVDEAYLDLTAFFLDCDASDPDTLLDAALPLARDIKQRIQTERGLTASIGIASNKFLAKLGSDFNKPDGLTLIRESEKVEFLRTLPVNSIHGVGPVTADLLNKNGISTIAELQDTSIDLSPFVGTFAGRLKRLALGIDDRPLDLGDERKSISSEHTFHQDTDHRPTLRAALREMSDDVAIALEKHGLGALTVQIKVRYSDFTTLTRQIRLEEPITAAGDIYRLACHLLARHRLVSSPLRLLGIGVSTLTDPWHPQLRLPL